MSDISLVQILEGALLAAGKSLTVAQLGDLFEEHERPDNAAIRETLKEIAERCDGRGFELQEVASGFRFQVRQSLSPWVARLWQERPQKYSRALLETLSLIAYRQPITRGEIEEIRGVAVSSNIIKTMHEREWIRVVGHRDVPGRPAMYATTRQFLDYFNLKNLDQLPALAEIRDLETLNAELGFGAPLPESLAREMAEEGEVEAENPGLTVVGGTDHVLTTELPPEAGLEDQHSDIDDTPVAAIEGEQVQVQTEGAENVPAEEALMFSDLEDADSLVADPASDVASESDSGSDLESESRS